MTLGAEIATGAPKSDNRIVDVIVDMPRKAPAGLVKCMA
jgi:hypothetical protein